jgi:hypothetical protein
MARLRVGDIQIDGSDVSIGNRTPAPLAPRPVAPGSGLAPLVGIADRLPFPAGFLVLAGFVLVVGGTLARIAFGAWIGSIAGTIGAGAMVAAGLATAGLGLAKGLIQRRPVWRHRAALGGGWPGDRARALELLSGSDPQQTLPWLAERTGWDEHRTAHVLGLLQAEGRLAEELDTVTGLFYYTCPAADPAHASLDLSTRLTTLSRGTHR